MKIRPRNIPVFQNGGVPQWYLDRYGNRTKLLGWDLNQRWNYSDENLNTNDHRHAGDLETVYRKNMAYTGTPGAISSDIQSFYNSDGKGMSAEDFVNFYNKNAAEIRSHWAKDQTYNADTAGSHNRLFRKMFASRSNQSTSPGYEYNIGYQEGVTKGGYDIQDIEGSSTWLRRMDQYENEFDPNNPDSNRLHEITLSDGTKATVYKKANGDIGLLKSPEQPQEPQENNPLAGIIGQHKEDQPGFWDRLQGAFNKISPDILDAVRLRMSLNANDRIYGAKLKGIRPNLQQAYLTHRQVVGDEATKQAYYRRAAETETKAARPWTSDADRQAAYRREARRSGNELRAQGDLVDNQEIRRTSDESNQHQWANTQRRTEAANYNTTQFNYANAAKQDLIAQKYAANHASWDNYIRGIQTRWAQKKQKEDSINDQIWAMQQEYDLANDPKLLELKKKADDAWNKAGDNYSSDPEVQNALRELRNYQLQRRIRLLQERPSYAKSGTKITYKQKDDLLYKSARDVVEHFRKMSKMSDDSTQRSRSKPVKLSPHPKSRKMQQGGVAPFTVFTPMVLGGETSVSSQIDGEGSSRGSSKKDDSGKDTLDMMKELFKQVNGQGLPVDVDLVYKGMREFLAKSQAFGNELSTEDIASMYLNSMRQLNNLKYSKEAFDKARTNANNNDALNEYAVTPDGRLVAQDTSNGNIKFVSLSELKDSKTLSPLTNDELLHQRAYNPKLALQVGDQLMEVVNNGIGMSKIAQHIKSILPSLGSSETVIEGYTKKESNQIRKGLEALAEAPDGDYKRTITTKEQSEQVKLALRYLNTVLPKNMKTILGINAAEQGTSTNEMLASLVGSGVDFTRKEEYQAVTGKAAKKEGNGENGIDSDKIKTNPLLAMQREMGGTPQRYEIITKDSNTRMSVNGTFYSAIPKVKDDTSIDKMLSQSGIDGILDSKYGITFGDQQVNPENLKDIMYSNTGGIIVTLPCKVVNGHKQVNLAIRESYEKAEQEALAQVGDRQSPQFQKVLGDKLKEHHLDSLLDSAGRPNRKMFAQFLVVEAYTTDKVKFDTKSQYVERVQNPDDSLEQRMSKALSTDNKQSNYSIDSKNHWFEMFYDDIYRGTVFIPLNNNPNSAMNSWGNSDLKIDQSQDLEELYQLYNKSADYKNNNSLE